MLLSGLAFEMHTVQGGNYLTTPPLSKYPTFFPFFPSKYFLFIFINLLDYWLPSVSFSDKIRLMGYQQKQKQEHL